MRLFINKILCTDSSLKEALQQQRMRLYKLAFSWSHNASLSDDLVQETMVKALKNIRQLRKPDAINQWLNGILANCWKDHFRQHREFEDIDEQILYEQDTPEHQYERQHICKTIRTTLTTLPVGQRQVITLVDLEGSSYSEVAEILQIPIGTVMSRLCRARKALAEKLIDVKPEMHTNIHSIDKVRLDKTR
ncbi:MAG: sigma-70 family RNA polymerase sigma factor [Gammaproteobacteria bacterium]|nr:sigma-70 family RNA polymerase sigma factor [Gammaproteobacteria bacterium]